MGQEGKVGGRFRAYREKSGLSVADLSERSGIGADSIESLEKGGAMPPLAVLSKIARALGQRLGTFMDDQFQPDPIVTRSDDAEHEIPVSRGCRCRALAAGKPDRQMDPFRLVLEPGCADELSSHEGEEFIICLKGEVELVCGAEKTVLAAGDTAYYNSVVKHSIKAVGSSAATVCGVVYMPL